jgi:hypothetical protein
MASQLLGTGGMGRYLCIVRRDDPLLQGYVRVALSERMSGDDEFEIIVDRRSEETDPDGAPDRVERRRQVTAQRRLNTEGYVLVRLDDRAGRLPAAAARRRGQGAHVPWRGLLTVGACLVLVITGVFAMTVPGGLWGTASGWVRSLGAAIEVVAGLPSWLSSSPARLSPSRAAPPMPPATPPLAEPRSERPPVEAQAKPSPDSEGGARVAPSQDLAAAPPELPPRPSDRPSGAPVPRRTHTPEEPARVSPDPVQVSAPTSVSRAASTAGFPGVPEVEVEWHRVGDGEGTAYAARLRDEAGHPVAASEVALILRVPGEGMREVPLTGTGDPGTYQGRIPGAGPDPDDLRVRVVFDGKRVEIPTRLRSPGHGS